MSKESLFNQRAAYRKYWMMVSALIVVVIVGVPVWVAVHEWRAASILNGRIEAIKSEGLPTDNSSLADWFKSNSHTEGTDVWEEVIRASKEVPQFTPANLPIVGDGRLPPNFRPDTPWPEADSIKKYLDTVNPILQKMDQASSLPPPVWIPIEFRGVDTVIDQPKQMVAVVRILQLDGLLGLYQRDTKRALLDIQRIGETTESFDWNFCMVAQMVSISLRSFQTSLIQQSLNMDLWNEDELARLQTTLIPPRDFDSCWNKVALGERAGVLATVNNFALDGDIGKYWKPIWSSDKLALLKVYDEWLSMGEGGMDGLVDRTKQWRLRQIPAAKPNVPDSSPGLKEMLLPSLDQYAIALEREEDCRRLLATAIAVKQFQRQRQRFPSSLEELTVVGLDTKACETVGHQPFGFHVAEGVAFVWAADRLVDSRVPANLPPFSDPELEDPWHFITIR